MMESLSVPSLYSFISYRREAFGGYLFNPYLQVELALSHFDLSVVELCDGQHPVALMPAELARIFRTDRSTAEGQLLNSLGRLNGYCALNWKGAPLNSVHASSEASKECSTTFPTSLAERQDCLSAPLSVLWEVTHACNLSCMHCLSSSGSTAPGELSTTEAQALIEELARLGVFSVTFGGGEPLVREDIFTLLERITEKNLAARLSTNGYLVTNETLRKLADLNVFAVQVSVDGLKRTHDRFRGRRGAFDRAVRALKLFREAGYHTFLTATVVASNVVEMPALLDLALEIGVSTFKIGPYVPMGRAKQNETLLSLSPRLLRDLAWKMRQKKQELGGEINLQIDGLFPWLFDPEPAGRGCTNETGPGCSAGISQVTIAHDGHVYPCAYLRDRAAGNVRRNRLGEIWCDEKVFGPLRTFDRRRIAGTCRSCAHRATSCRGGCRGAAMAASGDLYGRDPNCWHCL